MRIAIDSKPLKTGHKVRGVGVYTRELIRALKLEAGREKALKIEVVDFEKEDLSKYDIVHYPYFSPFFTTLPSFAPNFAKASLGKKATKGKPLKTVVTIHDLIPLIYPKQYAAGIKGRIRFQMQKFFVKRVDAVIVPSETSKKDVVRFLGVPQEKIKVIYEAPREIFQEISKGSEKLKDVKKRYKLPDRFVLYVGDINYNKNITGLIKACKLAGLPLVICGKQALDIETEGVDLRSLKGPRDWIRFILGKPHPELAHYSELLREFRRNLKVVRLGFVPDEDLVAIYNLATVYVQPSFYEGFGLPVLEAMASGCPVVVTKTNALVEVAGNASLVADPKRPKDLAEKILEVFHDDSTRLRLSRAGKAKVKEFSWERVARETVEFYKKIIVNG